MLVKYFWLICNHGSASLSTPKRVLVFAPHSTLCPSLLLLHSCLFFFYREIGERLRKTKDSQIKSRTYRRRRERANHDHAKGWNINGVTAKSHQKVVPDWPSISFSLSLSLASLHHETSNSASPCAFRLAKVCVFASNCEWHRGTLWNRGTQIRKVSRFSLFVIVVCGIPLHPSVHT